MDSPVAGWLNRAGRHVSVSLVVEEKCWISMPHGPLTLIPSRKPGHRQHKQHSTASRLKNQVKSEANALKSC